MTRPYILALVATAAFSTTVGLHAREITEATPDTVIIVDNPSRIVITENGSGSGITVTSVDGGVTSETSVFTPYPGDASISSRQSESSGDIFELPGFFNGSDGNSKGWKAYADGLCIGLNNPVGMGPHHGLQWAKSFEIGWLSCLSAGYSWGKVALTVGLGFDWRNYKITTSDRYLTPLEGGGLAWSSDLPDGYLLKHSRLKIFSIQLPLLLRARIPGSCLRVKAGPLFCFNTYGSVKTVCDDAVGNRCELFTKDIKPRRFTLDLFGSLSISNTVALYVRYSPMKVMDAAPSLNFRPLTVGVGIGI